MVNDHLRKMRKYHGKNIWISNRSLCHTRKGKIDNLDLKAAALIDPATGWS